MNALILGIILTPGSGAGDSIAALNLYYQPGGVSVYRQPDGSSLYLIP